MLLVVVRAAATILVPSVPLGSLFAGVGFNLLQKLDGLVSLTDIYRREIDCQ